jgi:hypothetical protein
VGENAWEGAASPGKVAVWAGWTHHGKTQMLKQLMLHGIEQGEKPLIASMEEEPIDVWTDLATMACGEEDPAPREVKRFVDFIRANLWLYDQEGLIGPRKVLALIRFAAAELKITQVVVDSLMMLAVDRDDYEAQARFVGELKGLREGHRRHRAPRCAHAKARGQAGRRGAREPARHFRRPRDRLEGRLRFHPVAQQDPEGRAAGVRAEGREAARPQKLDRRARAELPFVVEAVRRGRAPDEVLE